MIVTAGVVTAAVRFSLPVHTAWTILPAGLWIAAGLITCGLLLLFDPVQRSAYAVLAILLAIVALMTSHLGGYLVGTLLGLAGGAVAFAWVPMMPAARVPLPAGFRLIRGEADGTAAAPPGTLRRHAAQPGRSPSLGRSPDRSPGRPAGRPAVPMPAPLPVRRPGWARPEVPREESRPPAWAPDMQRGPQPGWQRGTERPRQRDRD
jgi:hypothetical protein